MMISRDSCIVILYFNLQIQYESQLFKICQGAGDVTAINDLLSHGLDVNAFNKAGLHPPKNIYF